MILWNLNSHQLVSEHTWLTFELQFWVNFWVSRFLWWKPFFWNFISRLMLILCFQARLLLETCRECCLEQNPSKFVIFGAHLMIFRKLGLVWFLLLCVFCAIFGFGLKNWCFRMEIYVFLTKNAWNFGRKIFFFSSPEPGRAQLEEKMNSDVMTSSWRHKKTFFCLFVCCLGILELIVHMLELLCILLILTLLGQLLLLLFFMV